MKTALLILSLIYKVSSSIDEDCYQTSDVLLACESSSEELNKCYYDAKLSSITDTCDENSLNEKIPECVCQMFDKVKTCWNENCPSANQSCFNYELSYDYYCSSDSFSITDEDSDESNYKYYENNTCPEAQNFVESCLSSDDKYSEAINCYDKAIIELPEGCFSDDINYYSSYPENCFCPAFLAQETCLKKICGQFDDSCVKVKFMVTPVD